MLTSHGQVAKVSTRKYPAIEELRADPKESPAGNLTLKEQEAGKRAGLKEPPQTLLLSCPLEPGLALTCF